MIFNIQVLILCVLSLFMSKISGEWAGLAHSKTYSGTRLTRIAGVSFQVRKDECRLRVLCKSVNYMRKSLLCQLNRDAANDVTDLIEEHGSVYVERKIFKQNEGYNCNCSLAEKCSKNKTGLHTCSVEECERLFLARTMTFTGNMNSVGSKVLVNCKPVWRVIKTYDFPTLVTKCQPNGVWSEIGERKCGKEVFRGKENVKAVFSAWRTGSKSYDDSSCPKDATNQMPCNLLHYRDNDINQWESLNVSRVLFSVYNRFDIEVQYVLFNGAGSTKTNWFSQERILASSWYDVTNVTANRFSLAGQNYQRTSCMIRRRFLMGVMSGNCEDDKGWFFVTFPKNRTSCCTWDKPVTDADIIYSRKNTAALFSDFNQTSLANHFTVVIFTF